ncbi:MAG TPA: hypothetical protein DEH75_04650 [Bradyrhizobium sp.]|nr:hypothetical protein [Bradyrhizobium sp.]
MKAYVYGANGPEITDVARPVPKGTQVLVKVHACGLNRADLGMTKGHAHGAAGGVGTVLGMKHAFRAMRPGGAAGKGGAVVNIASVAATIAFPSIAVYSGTKSAVDRMTRVGAMEAGKLGYGVRVNCIYPGLIPTDMGLQLANDIVKIGLAPDVNAAVGSVVEQTPLGKLAEVSDIADAAVFLCSNDARFITGIGLPVDGGMGM